MKALLICPGRRDAVAALAETAPLANVPIFGKPLIEHWLEQLFCFGAKEVLVLAADRPEQVRAFVGRGERWGLRVAVLPETRELTPAAARAKYGDGADWLPAPHDATLMDRLPGLPEHPLFTSCADWFAALSAWMPRAVTPDRIGLRQIKPGVWAGRRARVSPRAELRAPCWLGENVFVGDHAVVGPNAVLEDKVLVERGAEISDSVVGPETFVGEFTAVRRSIACGSTLVNWRLDSTIKVPDAFLLCSLGRRRSAFGRAGLLSRFTAALLLLLTLPLALLHCLKVRLRGWPALSPRLAVRPRAADAVAVPGDTLIYYELIGADVWLRRWPQLWSIVRGQFAWVGNRPLSPGQAGSLANDFERLWLAAPIGLLSLGDAEGCPEYFSDEARAHASYYAAERNWRLDWAILAHVMFRLLAGVSRSQARERFVQFFRPSRAEQQTAH
jgi:hypothetical protein